MGALKNSADMFSSFGGEAECKIKYPATYAAIMKAASSPKDLVVAGASNEPEVKMQLLSVEQKHGNSSKIYVLVNCFVQGKYESGHLYFKAQAKQKNTGKILDEKEKQYWYYKDSKEYGATLELEIGSKDCEVILSGGPITNAGAALCSESFDLSNYEIIDNVYVVKHPVKKAGHPEDDKNINFFFWRSPLLGKYVDYKYPDGYKLFVPSEGSARFKEGDKYEVREIIDANLYLQYGNNLIEYTDFKEKISKTANGIKWDGIDNWNKNIKDFMDKSEGSVGYTLSVTCTLENMDERFHHTFCVSNIGENAHIDPIKFFWGCLIKGTLIAMADGSEKPIEDIKIGDKVKTLAGVNIVKDTVKGAENGAMIVIKTENGKEIKATSSHPFMTAEGPMQANYIRSGAELRTQNGMCKVSDAYADFLGTCEVYNLILEKEGDMFYANGVASGDFVMQNSLPREAERNRIAAEWLTDYDNFIINNKA